MKKCVAYVQGRGEEARLTAGPRSDRIIPDGRTAPPRPARGGVRFPLVPAASAAGPRDDARGNRRTPRSGGTTPPSCTCTSPPRPDDPAGAAGLPAPAAPARPVLHARPGLLGAARRGLSGGERSSRTTRPKVVRRAYSISCSIARRARRAAATSTRTDWLEFYIVLVRENPDGRVPALTPRLFALKEGDRLNIGEKITGHFTLDPVQAGRHGASSSAPAPARPRTTTCSGSCSAAGTRARSCRACCVRYRRDLATWTTHQRLMEQLPELHVPAADHPRGRA